MAYIQKYSTISKGNTFNQGIIPTCLGNKKGSAIIHPDYKESIPGANLRRMSTIVKMGLANTIKCVTKNTIDAIIVGTGLGSLDYTEKFLSSYINSDQSILSPTPFINSVHNTISGEIALHTNNKGYNSTYSQGGLSFEGALLDAIMLTQEGKNVIVGGIDESIPILDQILRKMGYINKFTSGSTFFSISPQKKDSLAKIITCIITKANKLDAFLNNNFDANKDLIISGQSNCNNKKNTNYLDYSKFSGIFMTNSAFGVQLGAELLNSNKNIFDGHKLPNKINKIFIINYASKNDIGIIILKK